MNTLEQLTDLVLSEGRDIAPDYQSYMLLSLAIANACGEAGRACFHRLCSLHPDYRADKTDRQFDHALKTGRGKNGMGTVFFLAEQAGIRVESLKRCNVALPASLPHTHTPAHVPYIGNEPETEVTDPPELPETLPQGYRWPALLQSVVDCGETDGQRDVLWLGALTVLGSSLSPLLYFIYGHKRIYPCLQTFVVAPPASGKGVLDWVRMLVQPIHDEMMDRYRSQLKAYHTDHLKWEQLGKEKVNTPEPEKPRMKALIISGNNTGTGILENLMDNEGHALMIENEADTISEAIGSEYGHWSDTLRKCFDHSPLAYNRRTNHEHRECAVTRLSLLMSGTPAQVISLIPSAENGLYSREVFYRLVGLEDWKDQTESDDDDDDTDDYGLRFKAWGEEWRDYIRRLTTTVSSVRFRLSAHQKARINTLFSQLFSHANATEAAEMRGSVVRMAVNAYRMMAIVAFLRSRERPELITPAAHVPRENVQDGVASAFTLTMSEDDFEAVLARCLPLYRHACHILTYLPAEKVVKRQQSPVERLFGRLPLSFTRKEAVEEGARLKLSEGTVASAIKRMTDKGLLVCLKRGVYQFK